MNEKDKQKRTANKGEWSEFYAFLKILENGELSAADKNLEIIEGKSFIFDKVIREEKDAGVKIYEILKSETLILITDENGKELKRIDINKIGSKTLSIFNKIKERKGSAFKIDEAEKLMNELLCTKVKADNMQKADIVAIIHDRITEAKVPLGFSVKSMVGGASTLLNAGKTTNFIFKVKGFSGEIDDVNSITGSSKVRDRLSAIIANGGALSFVKVARESFDSNLKKIDTAMPRFIARMLYAFFTTDKTTTKDLAGLLPKDEIFKGEFGLSVSDYEYKIKNFLDAVALGMVPSKEWDGFTRAHGGYIVVKEDGEVVCYHLYNRDEFRSYLYENTKFESASTTRHNYGILYKKDGELFFDLNLQIRFLK